MGAGRVIAMGRNEIALASLSALNNRVITVKITGDEQADAETLKKLGPADAYFDISPHGAASSTHFQSAIAALKHSGRVSLMGGPRGGVLFPYVDIMRRNLTLKGTWMYTRAQILSFVQLVDSGLLSLGEKGGVTIEGKFELEQWKEAFEAASVAGPEKTVVIVP